MTPVEIAKDVCGLNFVEVWAEESYEEIGAHIRRTILAILSAELERVEGMRKDRQISNGYYNCLTDHANYIKSQIKEIEEL